MINKDKIFTLRNKYNFEEKFNINSEYTIWKSYHNEELINRYNLNESTHIKLFNTSNIGYDGNSINHLNRFLSEGCCLVYPYLNNLKSDYIGFQHYKRYFNSENIDFNKLQNDYIQYFCSHFPGKHYRFTKSTEYLNIEIHGYFWTEIECGFKDDLIEFFKTKYPEYLNNEKELHEFYSYDIFICNWELYCQLAKFLYDYIEFINNKYNLDWSEIKWYNHIKYNFIKKILKDKLNYNKGGWQTKEYYGFENAFSSIDGYINTKYYMCNCFRIYSMNIEYLTSVFIYNHKHYCDENNMLKVI